MVEDKSENRVSHYHGKPITFSKGENIMINATEMAKPFGKTAKDWLRTLASKNFIDTLSSVRQICLSELVVIKQGGSGEQGTWMHEDVAMEFARWLSPQFAIWCNDHIRTLLTKGTASINLPTESREVTLAKAVLLANETIEEQKRLIAEQAAKIEADAPYVDYAESIMKVEGDLDMQSVARVLADNNINDSHGKPIGRNYLFKVLRYNFILMSDNRPYQKYVDKAYFGCYVHRIDTGWAEKAAYVPTVTPKGLKWLLEQIDKGRLKGIYKEYK